MPTSVFPSPKAVLLSSNSSSSICIFSHRNSWLSFPTMKHKSCSVNIETFHHRKLKWIFLVNCVTNQIRWNEVAMRCSLSFLIRQRKSISIFVLDGARQTTTTKTQFSQRKEHANFCISRNSFAWTKTCYYYIIRMQFMWPNYCTVVFVGCACHSVKIEYTIVFCM